VFYLAAMLYLPRVATRRWAFYLGFLLGYAIGVPHLFFLYGIFGWGAIGLWGVFALWFAFYLLLGRMFLDRWPRAGVWLLPFLWFALEFFRSELYPLRFSWLIPGFALSHPRWIGLTTFGVYGFSLSVMLAVAAFDRLPRKLGIPGLTVCLLGMIAVALFPPSVKTPEGLLVVGMQMESPTESQVLAGLDAMHHQHPEADLLLLSEYTLEGLPPESVRAWCVEHDRYLIVGGKDPVKGEGQFYNTIFVVSPTGEIVYRQAKVQPIPFFNDGLPAKGQDVWESPWGRLGIAICYDMSYTRVMDPLVEAESGALIIPAVDVISWGEWEHVLHAKIIPVRAHEYGLPLFRLGSSGISVFADENGQTLALAGYPGPNEILSARLPVQEAGHLPLDRYLALPIVCAIGVLFVLAMLPRKKVKL
ncbi:MAG: hypothetical protein KDA84_16870, partial [Planctomycetaceae bacterium]|nr:hypothetical protein [Planctomycetaceae bacterium]